MSLIIEKVSAAIAKGFYSLDDNNKLKDLVKLLAELKNAGLIKQPTYTFALVDTTCRTEYIFSGNIKHNTGIAVKIEL